MLLICIYYGIFLINFLSMLRYIIAYFALLNNMKELDDGLRPLHLPHLVNAWSLICIGVCNIRFSVLVWCLFSDHVAQVSVRSRRPTCSLGSQMWGIWLVPLVATHPGKLWWLDGCLCARRLPRIQEGCGDMTVAFGHAGTHVSRHLIIRFQSGLRTLSFSCVSQV